jgi:hypothetical protein
MSLYMEREQVKMMNPSRTWAEKVDSMTDNQVLAIYIRLKSQGKLRR